MPCVGFVVAYGVNMFLDPYIKCTMDRILLIESIHIFFYLFLIVFYGPVCVSQWILHPTTKFLRLYIQLNIVKCLLQCILIKLWGSFILPYINLYSSLVLDQFHVTYVFHEGVIYHYIEPEDSVLHICYPLWWILVYCSESNISGIRICGRIGASREEGALWRLVLSFLLWVLKWL